MLDADASDLVGVEASLGVTVTADMTAPAMGSGDVPVLATPIVIALIERAAVKAVQPRLDPALTTVGVSVEVNHVGATPVGARVRARAQVDYVENRRLTFVVHVFDKAGEVAEGTHVRVIVDRERFLASAAKRHGR
jgi:predicted thioesterase